MSDTSRPAAQRSRNDDVRRRRRSRPKSRPRAQLLKTLFARNTKRARIQLDRLLGLMSRAGYNRLVPNGYLRARALPCRHLPKGLKCRGKGKVPVWVKAGYPIYNNGTARSRRSSAVYD